MTQTTERIVEVVKEKYGAIARSGGSCCGPTACGTGGAETEVALGIGYGRDELAALPEEANLGLGCGAPLAHLALQPGETVVDLGSGGGIDALLAARQVGPRGRVIGVDMTPAMVERARRAAARAGAANVEFREGRLEALPVESGTVDAVTSNCVVNLVPDKGQVFREVARVLRPGGRLVISDIILDGALPETIAADVYAYVGCVSGAMERDRYFALLAEAGLARPTILRDVDYLALLRDGAPEEAKRLLRQAQVSWEDVAGRVRSVTYRAERPA